jgi:hypothetical protein
MTADDRVARVWHPPYLRGVGEAVMVGVFLNREGRAYTAPSSLSRTRYS